VWKNARFSAAVRVLNGAAIIDRQLGVVPTLIPPAESFLGPVRKSPLALEASSSSSGSAHLARNESAFHHMISNHPNGGGVRLVGSVVPSLDNPRPAKVPRVGGADFGSGAVTPTTERPTAPLGVAGTGVSRSPPSSSSSSTSSSSSSSSNVVGNINIGKSVGNVNASSSTLDAVLLLRFNRISQRSWSVTQTKIFDLPLFLESCKSTVYLVNYAALQQAFDSSGCLQSGESSIVSLEKRLLTSSALVASWGSNDYAQLIGLYYLAKSEGSLLRAWTKGSVRNSMAGSSTSTVLATVRSRLNSIADNAHSWDDAGVLAIEQSVPMLLVIRESRSLGLAEDCWKHVYANDLVCNNSSKSIADYVASLFPQFRVALLRNSDGVVLSDVVVKYHPHDCDGMTPEMYLASSRARTESRSTSFQTVGVLSDSADNVLLSFANQSHFRNIANLHVICHELSFEVL
jgi:hypothetical protein